MGKTLGILFGAMMFGLFFVLGANVATQTDRQAGDMPVSDILANLASAANDMVGEKAAHNIVINGAKVESDTRLVYYYRVVGGTHIDRSIVDEKTRELKRAVCRDRMSRRALDGGAHIRYSYRSIKGNELLGVSVTAMDCA
ncbi:MAG: hypothetical protein QNJ67_10605 [Kiloniellales bacterium]|nr:hypothetical protein [Kiloniellales bacterium]